MRQYYTQTVHKWKTYQKMEEVHLQNRGCVCSAHGWKQNWKKQQHKCCDVVVKYYKEEALDWCLPPNMSAKCFWITAWELFILWVAENCTIAFSPAN